MSHRFLCWALTPLLGLPAFAQSVISAHSGLINFSEGSVFLDDQRVEHQTGKFDQMNNGSELRTEDGRAEVLLTPATFLRLGSNSAIRMVSNQLDDTRVELLRGSAVLDQGSDTLANTSVTILYNLDQVLVKQPGRYRFDAEPPQVKVEKGDVAVTADGQTIEAGEGTVVPFEGKLTARKLLNTPDPNSGDDLDKWDESRDSSVAENNQNAAGTSDLAGVIDGWNKDPDSVLQSMGIPPYIPGMSSMVPPPGYGVDPYGVGGYGYSPYNSGLYGSTLYGSALYAPGLYGYGLYGPSLYGGPAFLYGLPLYGAYGAYRPSYVYRGPSLYSGRGAYGYGLGTSRYGYGTSRSLGIGRTGVGVGAGHVGFGGVHAGGGHR